MERSEWRHNMCNYREISASETTWLPTTCPCNMCQLSGSRKQLWTFERGHRPASVFALHAQTNASTDANLVSSWSTSRSGDIICATAKNKRKWDLVVLHNCQASWSSCELLYAGHRRARAKTNASTDAGFNTMSHQSESTEHFYPDCWNAANQNLIYTLIYTVNSLS